jgi:thioredoxin-like negative regulator of GroEL
MNFRVCHPGFLNAATLMKAAAFLGLFTGFCFNKAFAASPPSRTEINWQTDLKKAHAESVKLNRPMLLVFGADWCTYCRKMEQTTLKTPLLVSYVNNSFVPVRLDLQKDNDVAKILGVDRVPCTIVLSPRADLLGRLVGCVEWPRYRKALGQVRSLHRQLERKQREASRIQQVSSTQPQPAVSQESVVRKSVRPAK